MTIITKKNWGGVAVYLARIMLDIVVDDELPESQARMSFVNGAQNSRKSLNPDYALDISKGKLYLSE